MLDICKHINFLILEMDKFESSIELPNSIEVKENTFAEESVSLSLLGDIIAVSLCKVIPKLMLRCRSRIMQEHTTSIEIMKYKMRFNDFRFVVDFVIVGFIITSPMKCYQRRWPLRIVKDSTNKTFLSGLYTANWKFGFSFLHTVLQINISHL